MANSWQQIKQKRTESYWAPCLVNPLRTRLPVTWCSSIRSFCPVTVAAFWAVDMSLFLATTTCSQTLTKEVHKPMRREVGMDKNPEKDHKDSKKCSSFRNVEPQVTRSTSLTMWFRKMHRLIYIPSLTVQVWKTLPWDIYFIICLGRDREEATTGPKCLGESCINATNIGHHGSGDIEQTTQNCSCSTTSNSNFSNRNEIGSHMCAGLICNVYWRQYKFMTCSILVLWGSWGH